MQELLILTGPDRDQLREDIKLNLRVIMVSGSVLTVEGDPAVIKSFTDHPGVYAGSQLKDTLPDGLSDGERLMVKGWMLRQSETYKTQKKKRPGAGKNWNL